MSSITIGTPFNIDLEFSTAPLLKRVGVVMLDMVLLMLYMGILYRFVVINFDMSERISELVIMMGVSILPFLYFPITEILMNGQTPGKRLLGLKVMDKDGKEPTISQYLLRWLLGFGNYSVFVLPYFVSSAAMGFFTGILTCVFFICIFYFPDFLCSAISTKNQRLADLAAGTIVIDLRKKMSFSETIYLEINDEHAVAKYPEVMRLTDKDINGIKNLLNKKGNKKDDWEYRAMIVQKICAALDISSNEMDDIAFLEQLLRDYNYLTQRR